MTESPASPSTSGTCLGGIAGRRRRRLLLEALCGLSGGLLLLLLPSAGGGGLVVGERAGPRGLRGRRSGLTGGPCCCWSRRGLLVLFSPLLPAKQEEVGEEER